MPSIGFQNVVDWIGKRFNFSKNDWRILQSSGAVGERPILSTTQATGAARVSDALRLVSSTLEPAASEPPPASDPTEPPKEDPLTPIQYDMHRREYQMFSSQETFDGFRMEASKTVTPELQASHTLILGTTLREGGYMYQFGPTYSSKDGNLFIFSRFGTDGVTNGRIIKRFPHKSESRSIGSGKNVIKEQVTELKANFASSLTDARHNLFEFGYATARDTWASSLTAAWQGAWFMNGSFSQVIAPALQLGGELTWITSQGVTTGSIGGRYVHKNNFWSGQLSRSPDFGAPYNGAVSNIHGAKVQYLRNVNDRLSLGAELDVNTDMESAMKMAYEYTFKNVARVQGMVDTGGKVSMFCQDQTGFGVSGFIDFWKGDYKFGFIMHMVPQQEGPQPE